MLNDNTNNNNNHIQILSYLHIKSGATNTMIVSVAQAHTSIKAEKEEENGMICFSRWLKFKNIILLY